MRFLFGCHISSRVFLVSALAAIAGFSSWTLNAAATDDRTLETLSINEARPVAGALRVLAAKYGLAISYEDPRYVYAGDIADVTLSAARDPSRITASSKRVIAPTNKSLSLSYEVSAETGQPADAAALLDQILAAYASGGVGTFKIERTGELLHVVPALARNTQGLMEENASILLARISIPAEERSGMKFLEAFCTALSHATGFKVQPGIVPINNFMQYRGTDGAADEVARDVLIRVLSRIGKKLTWAINYDPQTPRYGVNISSLARTYAPPGSERELPPLPKTPQSPVDPFTGAPRVQKNETL